MINESDFSIGDKSAKQDDNNFFVRDIFVIVLYNITMVLSLFGNSMVCKVIFFSKRMRNNTNFLIANMAIADIICAITIFTQWFSCYKPLIESTSYGGILCAINKSMQFIVYYVSSLTVTAIAVDRYIIIHYPLKKLKKIRLFIAISWLYPIVVIPFTSVSLQMFTYSFSSTNIIGCNVIDSFKEPFSSGVVRQIRVLIIIFTQYLIPLTITTILYVKIMNTIWRRNVGEMVETQRQQLKIFKWRTIKMLMIVVVVFAVCCFPLNAMNLIVFFFEPISFDSCADSLWYIFSYWCYFSSCAYNPFIYWWFNDDFREEAKKFWYLITCRNSLKSKISSNNSRTTLFYVRENII